MDTKKTEITPQCILYGHVSWVKKVWVLTSNENTARNTTLEHREGAFLVAYLLNKVSLNDAFLVRHISEGPTRNRCHVTTINIIGWMTPNLDPEVFCCKMWSKIVSYLNKHEIWPKYGILSQWWLHTKLKKTSKGVFAVLSSSWRYPACDFLG